VLAVVLALAVAIGFPLGSFARLPNRGIVATAASIGVGLPLATANARRR